MSLTLNRPANAALMVMMIASTTLVAAPVNASGREAAPVRYGSSDRTSGNDKGRVIQAPIASRASGSFFAYPDEPINGRLSSYSDVSGRTPDAKAASYTKVADLGLPYVSPVEYASYVKVGKPYKKFGKTYKPDIDQFYNATGIGSWYGSKFHGNLTANGEVYDMNSFTAAHPTLPLPCFVEVTNLENGKSLVVRVNDRGPFAKNRIIDLSKAAAIKLDMVQLRKCKRSRKISGTCSSGNFTFIVACSTGTYDRFCFRSAISFCPTRVI